MADPNPFFDPGKPGLQDNFLFRAEKNGYIDSVSHSIYLKSTPSTHNKDILGTDGLWFPVAPSEITYSSGDPNWSSNQVVKAGEIPQAVGPGLSSCEFSGILPFQYDSRLCRAIYNRASFVPAIDFIDSIQKLKDSLDIVKLVITPAVNRYFGVRSELINEEMRITSFSWTEKSARVWHREYTIHFAGVRSASVTKLGPTRVFKIPAKYTPKAGEDLRDVAIRFYGDIDMWKVIAKLNGLKTADIPKKFREGPKAGLKLPKDRQAPSTPSNTQLLPTKKGIGASLGAGVKGKIRL